MVLCYSKVTCHDCLVLTRKQLFIRNRICFLFKYLLNHRSIFTKLLEKGKGNIKWIMSKSTHEWPRVTMSDHEWLRMTTSDHEWLRMTTNDHEWPRVTTSDHEWPRTIMVHSYSYHSVKDKKLIILNFSHVRYHCGDECSKRLRVFVQTVRATCLNIRSVF